MNIAHLIKKGRMDPVLETDRHGVSILIGWKRKAGSRKHGEFMLKQKKVWIDRQAIRDGRALSPGTQIVMDERKRQLRVERFDATHDDAHVHGELAAAAQCYMAKPEDRCKLPALTDSSGQPAGVQIPDLWPWEAFWWKPSPDDRVRELAKAGALFLAEADRLKRGGKDDEATQVQGLALSCAQQIDDIYGVGPLNPGPDLIEENAEK